MLQILCMSILGVLKLCVFRFHFVSTQGDVQLSVSTNLKNNTHVETQASYDPATLSLHTSTKTSGYHSTQPATGSTDSEPQISAKLSDSKTEASSTKISGYYSDQEEYCVPKSMYL